MFIRAKARGHVLASFRLEARKLAGDNVLQAQSVCQQPGDLDIVVAGTVLGPGDAVPRAMACAVELQENVPGVATSTKRKSEISASRQPLRDGVSEKLRVPVDRLGARNRELVTEVANFLYLQVSVPSETAVRRHDLDVNECSLVVDEETQVEEDCERFAVDIQRSAFLKQPHQVGRDSEFISTAVVEQGIEAVAIGVDGQPSAIPFPARKDAVVWRIIS